jgi:hypothetical protein
MTNLTMQVVAAVVVAYDFSQFGMRIDVGGSSGTLLTAILRANPALRGVLFDLPHVAEEAKQRLAAGLAGRCAIRAGDFFAAVPPGGDAYLLKWIIHDWDDERAVTLLKHYHRVMTVRSKFLVIEAARA